MISVVKNVPMEFTIMYSKPKAKGMGEKKSIRGV
jgi:hypothetical protein